MSLFHFWLGTRYQKWQDDYDKKSSGFVSSYSGYFMLALILIIATAVVIFLFNEVFGVNILTLN